MVQLALALLIPAATMWLMIGFALHNRRKGWRRPAAGETSPGAGGVWLAARKVRELDRPAPAMRRLPRPANGEQNRPAEAAIGLSLANLQQALEEAAEAQRSAQPDLPTANQVGGVQ